MDSYFQITTIIIIGVGLAVSSYMSFFQIKKDKGIQKLGFLMLVAIIAMMVVYFSEFGIKWSEEKTEQVRVVVVDIPQLKLGTISNSNFISVYDGSSYIDSVSVYGNYPQIGDTVVINKETKTSPKGNIDVKYSYKVFSVLN